MNSHFTSKVETLRIFGMLAVQPTGTQCHYPDTESVLALNCCENL